MVLIHVKKSETEQVLVSALTSESNDVVIARVVDTWNTRLRLGRLCASALGLADYGPEKREAEKGLDTLQAEADADARAHGEKVPARVRNEWYQEDPSGARTGNRCRPDLAEVIKKTVADAAELISHKRVARREVLLIEDMHEKIENIRGAIMICYPEGLPPYDVCRMELEGDDGGAVGAAGAAILVAEETAMWWAGKEFPRGQLLSQRVGRNEKTKIVAKLTKRGGGAPAREPVVSEGERKAMMAHYFKKQEEMKKLAEDDDDNFEGASWADPKAMKRGLTGAAGGVAFRAGGRLL
jgi:cilia- and flagella-associated protein 298